MSESRIPWREALAAKIDRAKLVAYLERTGWVLNDEYGGYVHKCEPYCKLIVPARTSPGYAERMAEALDWLDTRENRPVERIVADMMGAAAAPAACQRAGSITDARLLDIETRAFLGTATLGEIHAMAVECRELRRGAVPAMPLTPAPVAQRADAFYGTAAQIDAMLAEVRAQLLALPIGARCRPIAYFVDKREVTRANLLWNVATQANTLLGLDRKTEREAAASGRPAPMPVASGAAAETRVENGPVVDLSAPGPAPGFVRLRTAVSVSQHGCAQIHAMCSDWKPEALPSVFGSDRFVPVWLVVVDVPLAPPTLPLVPAAFVPLVQQDAAPGDGLTVERLLEVMDSGTEYVIGGHRSTCWDAERERWMLCNHGTPHDDYATLREALVEGRRLLALAAAKRASEGGAT